MHPAQVASPSQGHTETNETHNHALTLLETIYFWTDSDTVSRCKTVMSENICLIMLQINTTDMSIHSKATESMYHAKMGVSLLSKIYIYVSVDSGFES